MSNAAPHPEPTADGELLARCLESDGPARTALLEHLCAEHPERASSLRQLYGLLDEFGFVDEPAAGDADEAAPRLALPERIGPYQVLDLLGSGGMGIVYRAAHCELGREVALKVIHGPLARTEKARARFRREAALASRLDDPRICPVYEVGEAADGTPFLAMRLVPGETLAHAITGSQTAGRSTVALPSRGDVGTALPALLHFVEQIAHALHTAHERGLVHRDVKPGNVMVTPDGTPVLLDFGLAASDDDDEAKLTHTGDQLGTPHYMAPEQITGGAVDRRTDVYALGVLLYESLTGKPPFDAPRRHDLASQIMSADVPDPRRNQRAIGRDLWTVLQTALAKDPSRRYATAAAFAEDLRRVRCCEPILARPPGPVRRLVQFTRRHPFAATLLGVLSAAIVVFVFLIEQRDATAAALRATASARTAPAVALAGALAAVGQHRSVENLSALQEVVAVHHERLRLVHGGATWAAQWTRDGERLFTASDDGHLRVYDKSGTMLTRAAHNLRPRFGARSVYWLDRSPDIPGQPERFVTASDDGSARVFDRDGKELLRLDHRNEKNQTGGAGTASDFFDPDSYPEVTHVAWSHDGTRIATTCTDRMVRVWAAADGTLLHELPGHSTPMAKVAWAANGWLASADDVHNFVADPGTFAVILWRPVGDGYTMAARFSVPDSIHDLHWSNDSEALVGACHDGFAYVWTANGDSSPLLLAHQGPVHGARFSPDGKRILTGSNDQTIRLWTRQGRPLREGRHEGPVNSVEFATDVGGAGPLRILSTSRDQTVRVWDEELHPQFVLRGHDELTGCARLSPDGRQVVSTSWDNTVRVWDLVDTDTPRLVGHRGCVRALIRLPDGRVLSAANDRTARVWDLSTGRSVSFTLPTEPWNVDLTADGRSLLVGGEDGAVRVFDLATGTCIATHQLQRVQWAVAALLGDDRIAAGSRSVLQVFDGSTRTTWAETGAIYSLVAARNCQLLAGVGRVKRVLLWNAAGTELPGAPLPENVSALCGAWSPSESRFAVGAGKGGDVWIWDVPATDTQAWPVPVHLTGHDGPVHAIAWSPDGRLLAAAVGDGTVHLWDAQRETRLVILRGHGNAAVHAVVFANDALLLSGGADGAIQCWATSVDRMVELAEARRPKEVAFSGSANPWVFLLRTNRFDEAYEKGLTMLADPVTSQNPKTLWWMAWMIVQPGCDAPVQYPRMLEIAERAAARSLELAKPPDEWMLATMARVWWCKGDLAEAVEWQTRAVDATPTYRTHDRRRLLETLTEYRSKLPTGR